MTIDWDADHLQPIYDALGVSATLVLEVTDTAGSHTLTVIHKTEGITIEEGVNVYSNKPAVTVRMVQLTALGLTEDDINDATLNYNGVTWTVKAHQLRRRLCRSATSTLIFWSSPPCRTIAKTGGEV